MLLIITRVFLILPFYQGRGEPLHSTPGTGRDPESCQGPSIGPNVCCGLGLIREQPTQHSAVASVRRGLSFVSIMVGFHSGKMSSYLECIKNV